ncbi:magnesium transporter [Brachybacterium sp. J153]|uniref:magnesium transporter n=1 Tax=Brachybacterium sp. J153 TaxID=3116488 RepID=UPI002E7751DA|nr:magnesium transporter [Brachybacterium sp. J153]MEE1619740.1 magnesium transporter [Brachybacterium sp. J153]
MSEPVSADKPFPWKPVLKKLGVALGAVSAVVTILVFFVPSLGAFMAQAWWVGWVVSGLLGALCIFTLEASPWKRHKDSSAQVEEMVNERISKLQPEIDQTALDKRVDERIAELRPELEGQAIEKLQMDVRTDGVHARADRTTIQKLWDSFRVGERLYEQLYHWPHDKYFAADLADAFYDLEARLDRRDWQFYDPDVAKDVEEAAEAMRSYWRPLSRVLDGREGNYDLAVMQPPHGTWGRVEVSEGHWESKPDVDPWDEFYAFVTDLASRRGAFLRSMEKLSVREKDLGVRSRVAASLSTTR